MDKVLQIAREAVPDYTITIDEAYMANVKSDAIPRNKGFGYIEEFRNGTYEGSRYFATRTTEYEVWFLRFCDFESDGDMREEIREQMTQEAVLPFIRLLKDRSQVETVTFNYGLAKFNGFNVSISLRFAVKEAVCL